MAEPAAKPSAGSAKAETATAPAPWTVSVMNRRRVTVSPSKAPGMFRSAVYLDLGVWRRSGMALGRRTISGGRCGAARRRAAMRLPGAAPRGLGGLMVRGRTGGQRTRAGRPHRLGPGGIALGVGLGDERDHVGELGHGVHV